MKDLLKEVKKAETIIKEVDEIVNENLNKFEHGSEDFKQAQRVSNALLNAIRAIDVVKFEL